MSYTVNASILLTELPILERPAAAKAAGFDAVEFWWPFSVAVPAPDEIDAFVAAIQDAGVQLTGLNFFAGDMPGGDRGLVSWVGREDEFAGNIGVVVEIGRRLGTQGVQRALRQPPRGRRPAGAGRPGREEPRRRRSRGRRARRHRAARARLGHGGLPAEDRRRRARDHRARQGRGGRRQRQAPRRLLPPRRERRRRRPPSSRATPPSSATSRSPTPPAAASPAPASFRSRQWIADAQAGGYDGVIGLEYKATQADPFAWLGSSERPRPAPDHTDTTSAKERRDMTRIAFIGLGIMGLPMASNLVKAGYDVTGFNRSQEAIDKLVAAGGTGATSIADAVKDADVVITMVPDSPDVAGVVQGPDGVFANAKAGALWIDNSSIRPDVAKELAEEAVAAGFGVVDAPVSGGEQGAIDGGPVDHGRRIRGRLREGRAGPERDRQDHRARRPRRRRPDREGREPAHRRGQHPGARRGRRVPRGVRRRHRRGAQGPRRRPRRIQGPRSEGPEDARTATSRPVSASPSTTRIWASSRRRHARSGSPSRSAPRSRSS